MIPVAGSAYTYAYATLGEFLAWIIGWDLILEYLFGAADGRGRLVGLLVSLLGEFGSRPGRAAPTRRSRRRQRPHRRHRRLINLPAVFIVLVADASCW